MNVLINHFFPFFFLSSFFGYNYNNGSSTAPISSSTVLAKYPSNSNANNYSSSSAIILFIKYIRVAGAYKYAKI